MRLACLLLLAPLAVACEHNPIYCDGAGRTCAGTSQPYCNIDKHECEARPPADMAMCGAATCPGMPDAGDLGACKTDCDMALGPDLMPMCTPATVATSCPSAAKPICDTTQQTCRQCSSSADDAQCAAHADGKNHCNTTTHVCVGCNSNADCTTSAQPVCDMTTNTCRACAANSECSSKVCELSTGACVPTTMIAIVDSGGMTTAACQVARGASQDGNSAVTAYCDIGPTGITQMTSALTSDTRPYILVVGRGGGATGYTAIASASIAREPSCH
jgi:hypothetical protein